MEDEKQPSKPKDLGIHVSERIGVKDVFGGGSFGEFNAIGFLQVNPDTGKIITLRYNFLKPDKSSRPFKLGERILIEVR